VQQTFCFGLPSTAFSSRGSRDVFSIMTDSIGTACTSAMVVTVDGDESAHSQSKTCMNSIFHRHKLSIFWSLVMY